MVDVESRRELLYGPKRTLEADYMKGRLTADNVLKSGEYNFLQEKEPGVWASTATRDFQGDRLGKAERDHWFRTKKFQLRTHFEMRANAEPVPEDAYHISTTHSDYEHLNQPKPEVYKEDTSVRWPDMAPQYSEDRRLAETTEYNVSFPQKESRPPMFPHINTSKVVVPQDFHNKIRKYRGVHLELGDEPTKYESMASEAYNHLEEDAEASGQGTLEDRMKEATDVTKFMRSMEITSNVFREGDYNNAKQGMSSTHGVDYNKVSHTPSTFTLPSVDRGYPSSVVDNEARPSKTPNLISRSLSCDVAQVLKDAKLGRHDGENAHFVFGDDKPLSASIYGRDYKKEAHLPRTYYGMAPAPKGSMVLQRDPEREHQGLSVTRQTHADRMLQMAASPNRELQNLIQSKKALYHGNALHLSLDLEKHRADRQISLFHGDFTPAPSSFKTLPPQQEPRLPYNVLHTETVLPYPVPKIKTTDNQYNFIGGFMGSERSKERRRMKEHHTKSRLLDYLDTHFSMGEVPTNYQTHYDTKYTEGGPTYLNDLRPAGVTEVEPDAPFDHLSSSKNTQDERPDPFFMHQKHKISKRDRIMTSISLPSLPIHKASIMKDDYKPIDMRYTTENQTSRLRQSEILAHPPTIDSHLFHTDTSGRDNMRSTVTRDFIKPENMSGRGEEIPAC